MTAVHPLAAPAEQSAPTSPEPSPTDGPAPAYERTARREIAVFLAVTFGLIGVSTVVAWNEGVDVTHIEDATPLGAAAMYGQAFFPLLGALAARFTVGRRGEGWGFRRAPWRSLASAWAYSVAVVLGAGTLVWLTGTGGLDTHADGTTLLTALGGLTVLAAPYVLLALGEDVGWRGLLTTRLARLGGPRLVVLGGGLAWSAFHVPLIVWLGGTPEGVPVWFAVTAFTVGTTAFGAVLSSMQLRYGIWPGVVAHAVFNAVLYHAVEPLTVTRDATGWTGTETGAFAALVGVLGAAVWLRRNPIRTGA
ncbi:CPBP family intramembrane glutamic endopeptidase [Spongisporangium articulatum]|uniref:CPBP family intramembrane glutamic endopeptidase n=1 Tax=Spongisporangium articulatum TaxID=3362603 RepID=A0ABW8ALZ8_9ACTN